jgi:class 3 adenylate cyclase/ActR/RegA family two-component response regulator
MASRILLVQTDRKVAHALVQQFGARGDEVWQSWELGQAYALVGQVKPEGIVMDLHISSPEWINFIRKVRLHFPEIKFIMTSRFIDAQRERMAREQGVQLVLRHPITGGWIDQAVSQLSGSASKEDPPQPRTAPAQAAAPARESSTPAHKVRIRSIRMPVRVKITLPYLFLALLFALASAYIVSQVALESIEDRFLNQLIATGRQSTDWMVREESRLLESLRLIANTQGVADALQRQDAEALRLLVLPAAINSGEEAVELLDPTGVSVLSLRIPPGSSLQDYSFSRGDPTFQEWGFVQLVAAQVSDGAGDKFSGTGRAPWGDYFYVSGPIYDSNGKLAGILLVGKSLRTLVNKMHLETLGEVTLYDRTGVPIASTLLSSSAGDLQLSPEQAEETLAGQDNRSQTRDLRVSTVGYTEILGPWEARGGVDQGILGVAQAQAFLVRTSQATQMQIFALVAASILLVLLVGLYLASLITRPLLRLVSASSEVAQGNLDVKVDANGDDEVAVLADSFNYMVAGLQEGSIYRDLLGRTVSPQVREQLRQTFDSGDLRLEGQQAVATVLMSDIRGFTPITEKADPATVFKWLNEYFTRIVPIVAAHGGVVNKFDGDAMLAFFGILPRMLSPKQSAVAACQAALEILQAINQLNHERQQRGEPQLVTGIGLHTGVVISGGLGSSDRLHYTIIGDTVNTTQRIEALTRDLMECSGVLVSQATLTSLGSAQERFKFLPLGHYALKGKEEAIEVSQLLLPEQPEMA